MQADKSTLIVKTGDAFIALHLLEGRPHDVTVWDHAGLGLRVTYDLGVYGAGMDTVGHGFTKDHGVVWCEQKHGTADDAVAEVVWLAQAMASDLQASADRCQTAVDRVRAGFFRGEIE